MELKEKDAEEYTPQPRAPRRRLFGRVKSLVVTAAALVLVGAACFAFGMWREAHKPEAVPEISAVVLAAQLQNVSELATVSYHYTNMGQYSNSADFYGVKLPFTTKSFILTYDGVIKAGVDLSKVSIECGDAGVTVTLPAPAVLSHTIDEESLEVFDEKTSIFNAFTVEDYNGFQADQKAVMEEKAIANGLLDEAKTQAETVVAQLLAPLVPEGTELTVTCKAA